MAVIARASRRARVVTGAFAVSAALAPVAARRLRALLDSLGERLHEPPDRVLANLLTEHRRYALAVLDYLRHRRR